jgi:hypothetical protein
MGNMPHTLSTLLLCVWWCHRLGVVDLYKAAEEVSSAERSKQMLEEVIDEVHSRAGVVTHQLGQRSVAGGASDLLSSFNVATFKVRHRVGSTGSDGQRVIAGSHGRGMPDAAFRIAFSTSCGRRCCM